MPRLFAQACHTAMPWWQTPSLRAAVQAILSYIGADNSCLWLHEVTAASCLIAHAQLQQLAKLELLT
jgi:hypothetical protein